MLRQTLSTVGWLGRRTFFSRSVCCVGQRNASAKSVAFHGARAGLCVRGLPAFANPSPVVFVPTRWFSSEDVDVDVDAAPAPPPSLPPNLSVESLRDLEPLPEKKVVEDVRDVKTVPVSTFFRPENIVKEVTLPNAIFGVPYREDILQRVVRWQLARRRLGLAKTKDRGEVSGGGKKPFKQKGTGRARAGSIRSPLWRHGGTTHGPRGNKNWEHKLPKKVRKLGLKVALSVKFRERKLVLIDSLDLESYKTIDSAYAIDERGWESVLFIDGNDAENTNARSAMGNLHYADILPARGANVYSILNREMLVLTLSGLADLEHRLEAEEKKPPVHFYPDRMKHLSFKERVARVSSREKHQGRRGWIKKQRATNATVDDY